jgi:hypothetical protein
MQQEACFYQNFLCLALKSMSPSFYQNHLATQKYLLTPNHVTLLQSFSHGFVSSKPVLGDIRNGIK